jgi:hypothetical protein
VTKIVLLLAITSDTQSFTQSGRDDGFNVYTNTTADVFDLSVSLPEPDMPTTFPVTEKRKCDDISAAEDEVSHPRRLRRHDTDVMPSHEKAALCALQVGDCDGTTCTSQNSHVDALCTILSSSRLSLDRRDKAIKLVRKLLCRNNMLGIPANWTDEVEKMDLSGDDLENEHLPMQTLIERKCSSSFTQNLTSTVCFLTYIHTGCFQVPSGCVVLHSFRVVYMIKSKKLT